MAGPEPKFASIAIFPGIFPSPVGLAPPGVQDWQFVTPDSPGPPSNQNLAHQRILATVDSIPSGRIASYGQVAREAGLSGRARLVGRILRDLPESTRLPWHRVLNSAGRSSLDPNSPQGRRQLRRLADEGVEFEQGQRVDLTRFGWIPERA
jgi:methylated-DNA-protein-cysteine methyltransferase related protein